MRFSLLGPLVVEGGAGGLLMPAGPRLRVLLATLLLHANVPVPAEVLAEMVWDGSPPPAAVDTLRSYVRRLRQALGGDAKRVVAGGAGYLIRVDQPELDVLEFEALCRDTRAALRAREWEDGSAAAARALRLWRAAPLLDVPAAGLRGMFVPQLERLRLQVLEDGFDADLRLGQHQELIPQLLDITAQHPLEERFHAQLMLALAGAGRRAQALHAYQEARRALVGELGIEPGTELRDIHRQILAGDVPGTSGKADGISPDEVAGVIETSTLADFADALAGEGPPRALAAPVGQALPQPAQLPADTADFTGRATQVSYLHDALADHDVASAPGMARVVTVAGVAAVGKTTLAVHAAHQVRDFFPDGQLFAELGGASADPTAPGEVLARFLRDLGVDGGKIPARDEERAALYRTRLTGRRVLILLDDARDAAQVRPLLPGTASCAVLVTTRSRTPYLVSTGFVDLDTLPEPDALELFSRIVGDVRPAAEPAATAEILTACAGLPLAVRICAARLATRRQWRIATMAARLRDERRRLDELQVGDLEVRASFQVSYDSLHAGRHRVDPAHVFRLLGLWQGQRISLPAATALIGEREQDVAVALETLVDANLLESPEPDWYQFHDLLRLFAAERAQAEEPEEVRRAAVARLLRWYLEMAAAAADIVAPNRYHLPPGEPPTPDLPTSDSLPSSLEDALAWYDSERAGVIAAVHQAVAGGLRDVAWQLPTALFPLFNRRDNWADCITEHRIAAQSAGAAGQRQAEAWALQNLGNALSRINDEEGFARLEEALAIRREIGDRAGEAQTAISLANAYDTLRGPEAAFDHSLRCLEILRQAGNPTLLGTGLSNHGEFCLELGRLDEAVNCLQEALGIWTAIGGYGHGHAMENLGRVYLESGRLSEALDSLAEGHRLHLASGDLRGQAVTLQHLGEAQRRAGLHDQARESLAAALVIFENLKADAEAKEIRSALIVQDNQVALPLCERSPGRGAPRMQLTCPSNALEMLLECPGPVLEFFRTARPEEYRTWIAPDDPPDPPPLLIRRNSGTGGLEDYAKLSAELPVMRRISGIRPGFHVNLFYREDFVYLYDELSSPGKMSSRSCHLPPDSSSWLIPFGGAIAAQARSRPPADSSLSPGIPARSSYGIANLRNIVSPSN
jgi:DNA-binding SARP family transcriptional activator/tetratricopeptide (TPR) repeat protein